MTADQLFSDAELEPVEVVKIRFLWEKDGATWAGRCRACSVYLSWNHTADEARRSGLAALDGHVCRGQTDLPASF